MIGLSVCEQRLFEFVCVNNDVKFLKALFYQHKIKFHWLNDRHFTECVVR